MVEIQSCSDHRTRELPVEALRSIQRCLDAVGYHVLRRIEFEYRDGVVVLRGCVPTYYAKQLLQSALLVDPVVERVENLIEVVTSSPSHRRERFC